MSNGQFYVAVPLLKRALHGVESKLLGVVIFAYMPKNEILHFASFAKMLCDDCGSVV